MCSRKAESGRRVSGASRSLVNAMVLNKTLLVPVLICGSVTMIWKEKEGYRVRAVQMDKIRSLSRIPNAWIRELCERGGRKD